MRTAIVAVIAAVAGFIIGTLGYQNAAPNAPETQVYYETVVHRVTETIDLERLRDVSAASPHRNDNDHECAYAIQRLTDEPLAGIILYVDRWWEGDACAAYQHQVLHGWY